MVLQGFNATLTMLDSKGGDTANTEGQREPIEQAQATASELIDDDIPF